MGSDEPVHFTQRNLWKSRDGLFKDYVFQVAVFGIKEAGAQKGGAGNGLMKSQKGVRASFSMTDSTYHVSNKSLDLCIIFSREALVCILQVGTAQEANLKKIGMGCSPWVCYFLIPPYPHFAVGCPHTCASGSVSFFAWRNDPIRVTIWPCWGGGSGPARSWTAFLDISPPSFTLSSHCLLCVSPLFNSCLYFYTSYPSPRLQ